MRTRYAVVSLLIVASPGPRGAAAERTFAVDASASRMTVSVDRAGLFSFAGHAHEVLAVAIEGTIQADPADAARGSVALRFAAAALKVSGKGEPPEDVPKVQGKMLGPEVLDAQRFPEIAFRSSLVEGREAPDGTWNLRVTGELTIRGQAKTLTLPIRVQLSGDTLTATGQAVIKQTDFGIKPISVGGVVKVKNELGLNYKIVAKAAD
jgi:polyisoprenoid-binding protein YceI